jgi:hypothetical protein
MLTKVYYVIFATMIMSFVVFASCRKKEKVPLVPDDYRSWNKTIDEVLDYPIPGHESNCRIIYINATGEQVQPTKKNNRVFYDYPEGTIIVKEIYAGLKPPKEDEIPEKLTVMIKDAQHPNSRNGWLWIVKDVKTGEETIIDYEFCVECHANANEPHPYGDKNPNGDFRDYAYFLPSNVLP